MSWKQTHLRVGPGGFSGGSLTQLLRTADEVAALTFVSRGVRSRRRDERVVSQRSDNAQFLPLRRRIRLARESALAQAFRWFVGGDVDEELISAIMCGFAGGVGE